MIKEKFDTNASYLAFYGIISALKALKRTFKDNPQDKIKSTEYKSPFDIFLRCRQDRVNLRTKELLKQNIAHQVRRVKISRTAT